MTLQQSDGSAASNVARIKEDIDRLTDLRYGRASPTALGLQPPGYGMPQRDAAASMIDSLSDHICTAAKELHEEIDSIVQRALTRAAEQKHQLNEDFTFYAALHDEVDHVRAVVNGLKERGL
ncbi:hypothetical protein ABID65_006668 [Bradyrhizobium sp. S3.9.2]|uniref:hypothetical protein n=1 Tax=Bradyrhizobium sp. S3.9.2 TaxID=3156432 RepID=UPI0033910874